jgi:hypothetical protein
MLGFRAACSGASLFKTPISCGPWRQHLHGVPDELFDAADLQSYVGPISIKSSVQAGPFAAGPCWLGCQVAPRFHTTGDEFFSFLVAPS